MGDSFRHELCNNTIIHMEATSRITVALGDGIGPEIMDSVLRVLTEAGAGIEPEFVAMGESAYRGGCLSGVSAAGWESLQRTHVLLKAPTSTPRGGQHKSAAVSIRKRLGLFANVRPCLSYHPLVPSHHPRMDVVVVHENEEDLYAGIEYRQIENIAQALKLATGEGSERAIRFAFEYADQARRSKITCFTKSNILKLSDGVFHEAFEKVGAEFPQLEKEHRTVDIGFAKLAVSPESFDIVVLSSVYGDILSDVAAELAGSVGMACSGAIGYEAAMFEAIHGSAPRLAGRNTANPSGMLLAALTMLDYIGKTDIAQLIHLAWLRTLEDGIHTRDITSPQLTKTEAGTKEFTRAVIARLGQKPSMTYLPRRPILPRPLQRVIPVKKPGLKETVGVDLFIDWPFSLPDELAQMLRRGDRDNFSLQMILNRGQKVWPEEFVRTDYINHWCARFMVPAGHTMKSEQSISLLEDLRKVPLEVVRMELLCNFNGIPGYVI
jgi:isocitrate dehydrogenase